MKKLALITSIILAQIVLSNAVLSSNNFDLNLIVLPSFAKGTYMNNSVSTVANTTTSINATTTSQTSIIIQLVTRTNVTNSSITIVEYNSTPPNKTNIGIIGMNEFFEINVDSRISSNLNWAMINISYNESELVAAGLDEGSLKMYRYNTTSESWSLVVPSGVNTVNKYVWANVTGFSFYGIGGSLHCGNGVCDAGETNSNCPSDCVVTGGAALATGGNVLLTGGCTYNWTCTEWSDCLAGIQTRACYNKGTCKDNKGKPVESRSCSMPSIPANITPSNITPPVPAPVTAPTQASTSVPVTTPTAPVTPLSLGVGLIAVIAISIVITAIILKKRKKG